MRVLIICLFLLISLQARENPFVPLTDGTDKGARPAAPDRGVPAEVGRTAASGEEAPAGETETVDFGVIRFFVSGGEIQIETKDRLKQHFAIKHPTRFILNFSSTADFPTRKQTLKLAPFHEIRVGAHKGYYSVVIELDSPARYKMRPADGGYALTLY
jgi:hypothetical protein